MNSVLSFAQTVELTEIKQALLIFMGQCLNISSYAKTFNDKMSNSLVINLCIKIHKTQHLCSYKMCMSLLLNKDIVITSLQLTFFDVIFN